MRAQCRRRAGLKFISFRGSDDSRVFAKAGAAADAAAKRYAASSKLAQGGMILEWINTSELTFLEVAEIGNVGRSRIKRVVAGRAPKPRGGGAHDPRCYQGADREYVKVKTLVQNKADGGGGA